ESHPDSLPKSRPEAARHYSRRAMAGARFLPRFLALFLVVLCLAASAGALDLPPSLEAGERVVAAAVIDGDTLLLEDGREVRLVGLQAPKLPLGRPDFPVWPLAEEAKAALEALVLGEGLTLAYGGRQLDRHGRALAQLYRDDGTWIQGELLKLGMARVYSFGDNRALAAEMLAIEQAARDAGRGIWGLRWYAIRGLDAIEDDRDSFQLVEGRVLDAARAGGRGYLNFGADWKTDFTLSLDPATTRLFDAAGLPIEQLEGRRVRARGWVEYFNGPMIEITHPEQIEVLDE
ncbi:MAG: thermonuclease family protein, partial [Rhodospirillaceae bacterium]|nr:thermonuclease family protein [Rhodospirillaceae bacterium]